MDKILLALSEFRTEMKTFFTSAGATAAKVLEDLKAELATAQTTIAARDAAIKELQTAATTATTSMTAKDGEITTLKASVDAEKKRANAVFAGQGLAPEAVPAAEAAAPGTTPESAWNKYHALLAKNPSEAGRFYAANADKIFASRE